MPCHLNDFSFGRSGGGIGCGDIRKMAYFESSIDPSFTGSGVCPIVSLLFFLSFQRLVIAFRLARSWALVTVLLKNFFSFSKGRDKTRVIVYRCPGNTAVQVTHIFPRCENILARFIGNRKVFSCISFHKKN